MESLIKPAAQVLFNFIFIPSFVDFVSNYEGYENKSKRYKRNLLKYFTFIMIASVFIPITGSETY